jgi:hypothetical protein
MTYSSGPKIPLFGGLLLSVSIVLGAAMSPARTSATVSSWSVNERVNDDTGTFLQDRPDITVDASGSVYAVWRDLRNATHDGHWDLDIYFSYRPDGGGWGANQRVNDDASTQIQDWPAIAADGAGNAYAVWKDYRNGYPAIYFSYRPAGGSWSTNQRVDDGGTRDVDHPDIAIDSAGNLYALWQDWRNGDPDVYFSYQPAGGSWGANERVSDAVSGTVQYSGAIAADGAGDAYAVWTDMRNGDPDIYFSYRAAGGNWSANERVSQDPGHARQWNPDIAVDTAGNAYSVWQDDRNGHYDVYASYRPADGGWGTAVRVNDDAGTAGQYGPAIAEGANIVAAVWQDERAGGPHITYSYRLATGAWSANERISDDPGEANRYNPAIVLDALGSAYAVWSDERSGNPDIYCSYRGTRFAVFLPSVLKSP